MQKIRIRGGKKLNGTVDISGSKNATLPVMTAALLAKTPTTLTNVPHLNDIKTMAEVLRRLGAKVLLQDH
ncbi:MAG TPA: UDP-N-acetylglucosamine 1-carboxyvinyltransferase, partial [bacterium]|nr:UDP-N-acetylglucosamine 1-carboxyvinyltransferase [bacterium]